MKTTLIALTIIALSACMPEMPHTSKDVILITTSQRGVIDTFKINTCTIYLNKGDLCCINDTENYHATYRIIASGIYKFRIIKQ
jgi:hypothetical protein